LSICDIIFHNRLPPLERSSANTLITHTTVENISQQSYIENNDNSNMTVSEQPPQKTFDIVSEEAGSLMVEQNTVIGINIDKNISVEDNNVFGDYNKSKPNIVEVGSKNNIPADNIQKVELPQSTALEIRIENQKKRIRSPSPVGVKEELAKKEDHDRVYKSLRMFNTDENSDDDMEMPEIIMEGPDSEFEDNE